MYGDIYEQQPTNWWGEPIEGQYILLSEFLEDLKQISSCKNITIRMNSYGGDAGASNMIHNRLRELSRSGAKLTCIVDGVAMSGGSIIMCACDTAVSYTHLDVYKRQHHRLCEALRKQFIHTRCNLRESGAAASEVSKGGWR